MSTDKFVSDELTDELTPDEQALFERIQSYTDDERVHRLCEIVLQSSTESEEANS
ncbi:kinesin [Salinigranum rubrum]|uniref:Kinesin n=1 Tax=Salinigranum rubrum TaxID=755307 RepID=A0A2I8VH22_9EURY|nr:kinesin [Salinigranum rubrum]